MLLVAFAVFVSGCAAATGPDGAGGGETSKPRREDPAPDHHDVLAGSEPPGSTLSYGGQTVDGGLGGYCWSGGDGGSCVDAVGVSLEDGRIEAPTGATLSFDYGGRDLTSLDVAAYRADREDESGVRDDDVFVMPSGGEGARDLPISRSGTRARVVADLPAGEYVLDARARMPGGDASYGFRLILGLPDTADGDPAAYANVRFDPALPVDRVRRVAAEHGVEAGMIEGQYRIGGEVHTWGWTGGLGADFEKERLASFADITGGAGQAAPSNRDAARETSAMREAVEEKEAGPVTISGIEFRGPESVLEKLVRAEDALISQADVTTDAEMREMLRNLPKGCCN